MAINLSRNTKLFFTTNLTTTASGTTAVGSVSEVGLLAANTFEIQVLDGYSFSQSTAQSTIQISEAGDTPSRGQRAFNTALNPVDFSFSTYIRPYKATYVSPAEKVLWNALLGEATIAADAGTGITSLSRIGTSSPTATLVTASAIQRTVNGTAASVVAKDIINIQGFTGAQDSWNDAVVVIEVTGATTYTVEYSTAPLATAGSTATTAAGTLAYAGQWAPGTAYSYVTTMGSNKNVLQKFGLIFAVDQVVYAIDNCAMDQVSIDFGLDAIAMCTWTGKGTALRKLGTITKATLESGITATQAVTTANYITNKLSTLTLASKIGGSDAAGSVAYNIPITGGNVTIANNINYLVPTNLAVVNKPIGYYTGQRAITGNVTAYLRTGGSDDSGTLLVNQLAAGVEPAYKVQLNMGGTSAANRLEFEMPGAILQIPAVNVADVIATTINFLAQGFDPNLTNQSFDVTKNNDLTIRYFSA